MAVNFPGPYGVRLFYTVDVGLPLDLSHVMEWNVDFNVPPPPRSLFSDLFPKRRSGQDDTFPLDNHCDSQWAAVLANLYNINTVFNRFELWRYTPGTSLATFISSFTPVLSTGGVSASAGIPAGQALITFRTEEGGVAKMSLMESILAPSSPSAFPTANADVNALTDLWTRTNSVWLGRDTSYIASAIRLLPGQNEALFKRHYRA